MILHKEETFRDETTEDTGMIIVFVRPWFYLTIEKSSKKKMANVFKDSEKFNKSKEVH